MTRLSIQSLFLFAVWLAWLNAASAQAPTWTVTKVERSDMGSVTETKLNLMTGLTETKHLLVLGKKNEFLTITMTVRPDKKGGVPTSIDFKVVDADKKSVGKQTFFLKGKNNNLVTMVFQGDWTTLDGLSLEGPGRSHAIGKAVPKK